jgi:CheY-like chemotaxis protein
LAKILCIDDYQLYAEMIGTMLERYGHHQVKVDVVPLVMDEVLAFDPDVIVLNLVRKAEVLGAPIHDFYREVDGGKALQALAKAEEIKDIPVVLTALAVRETEVPLGLHYEAFIEIPQKIDVLRHTIDRLATARRKDSDVAPK